MNIREQYEKETGWETGICVDKTLDDECALDYIKWLEARVEKLELLENKIKSLETTISTEKKMCVDYCHFKYAEKDNLKEEQRLLDYFAGQAISSPESVGRETFESTAGYCYRYAEAMLAERKKRIEARNAKP